MKMTNSILITFLVMFTASCFVFKTPFNWDEYEKYIAEGDKFSSESEHEKALVSYKKALEIAKTSGDGDSITLTYGDIAKTYCLVKLFRECENELLTARDYCLKEPSCTSGPLKGILNKIRFLYVFSLKDGEKTDSLVGLLDKSREKLGRALFNEIGCRWAKETYKMGFEDTSKKLVDRHRCKSPY